MYRLIYPVKNRALFTNRVVELETLELYKNRLLQGEANKIAFIGTRRIGKSTVLYEFIKRHAANRKLNMIYVNLQRMVMEPLSFAKSYIGLATKWVVKDREDNFANYDDPDYCMLQLQKLHPQAAEYLFQFIKLTQVRNVSLKSVLEQAFQFPKILSECLNRPFIVMIDEFQDIMLLNNFKQLPDILGFLRDRFQIHQSILYVFAGSYIRLMQSIIEDPNSAFFGQINPYYLSNFDKKDSMYFLNRISKQLQFDLPDEVKKKILKISAGHPFYMEILTSAANEAALIDGEPLTPESIGVSLTVPLRGCPRQGTRQHYPSRYSQSAGKRPFTHHHRDCRPHVPQTRPHPIKPVGIDESGPGETKGQAVFHQRSAAAMVGLLQVLSPRGSLFITGSGC